MKRQSLQMRLELLRLRGQIERMEVATAWVELKTGARHVGAIVSLVSNVGNVLGGTGAGPVGGLLDALAGVGGRSLWASVALTAVRAIRRRPVPAIALTAGVLALAGWWIGHRKAQPAAPEPDRQ